MSDISNTKNDVNNVESNSFCNREIYDKENGLHILVKHCILHSSLLQFSYRQAVRSIERWFSLSFLDTMIKDDHLLLVPV